MLIGIVSPSCLLCMIQYFSKGLRRILSALHIFGVRWISPIVQIYLIYFFCGMPIAGYMDVNCLYARIIWLQFHESSNDKTLCSNGDEICHRIKAQDQPILIFFPKADFFLFFFFCFTQYKVQNQKEGIKNYQKSLEFISSRLKIKYKIKSKLAEILLLD